MLTVEHHEGVYVATYHVDGVRHTAVDQSPIVAVWLALESARQPTP